MKKINVCKAFSLLCLLCFAWQTPVQAADQFSLSLVSPSPAEVDMRSTGVSMTFRVTNTTITSTDKITAIRFRINNGDVFASATPPAGWAMAFTATAITFTASSVANGIPTTAGSNTQDFPIVFNFTFASTDISHILRDIRSTFTPAAGGKTTNVNGSVATAPWMLKALSIAWAPSSYSVGPSCTFTLTATITNLSSSNLSGITTVPKPPTVSPAGSASPGPNPSNLTLNANTSGTMAWTYTAGATGGTNFTFTACAATGATCTSTSGSTRTSRIATSSPAIVITSGVSCGFDATMSITAPAACPTTGFYSDDTATLSMQVKNSIVPSTTLSTVTPSTPASSGTASMSSLSSPSPVSIASLAGGGATGTFTWTAKFSGNSGSIVAVSGYATGTDSSSVSRQSSTSPPTTNTLNGYPVTVTKGITVNAANTNQEITWHVLNNGCNAVSKVAIPIPSGWTWTDSYSLVETAAGTFVEAGGVGGWTAAQSGTDVVFTAGTNLPTLTSCAQCYGDFSVTFSIPASASGVITNKLSVTDGTTSVTRFSDPGSITVNPFDPAGANATGTGIWREIFQ